MSQGLTLAEVQSTTGVPFLKFPTPGTIHDGIVVDVRTRQKRDFDTKEPKFWKDGSPEMEFYFVLQTQLRSDEYEDDDGRRAFTVKSWGDDAKALTAGMVAAGVKAIMPGMMMRVTFTHEVPGKGNARKVYTYQVAAANNAPQAAPAQPYGQIPAAGHVAQAPPAQTAAVGGPWDQAAASAPPPPQAGFTQSVAPQAQAGFAAHPQGLTPEQQAAVNHAQSGQQPQFNW